MESSEVCTKQQRIAELAQRHASLSFTSLAHHINAEWLREAYRQTRKDAAAGVDNVTATEYGRELEANLRSLLERFKSGEYVAPPLKRRYIPKDEQNKEQRPIDMPTFEDKVLQRAVVMLLQPIYEHDFLSCSYGFRPGRGPHMALEAIWHGAMEMGGCWILEVDIRKYFETVKHEHLREFLRRRVSDGVVRRVIGKWLKAGVVEDGSIRFREEGTAQGGVISPLLSNIYLHEVLDRWFTEEIAPRMAGTSTLIRYADDFVILFKEKIDADRVRAVLPKRFGRYGLSIHPDKTRVVWFGKPKPGEKEPETFDFLGFTHYWGKSRKGSPVVKRKTAKKRLKRSIRRVSIWCKEHRHLPIRQQWQELCAKVRGHYGFYGITHNFRSINLFERMTERVWRYWLGRRSRNRDMPWERFKVLLEWLPLPRPRVVHCYLAKP